MLTAKERVLSVLNFQEADRVPLDIGGINNTTMHVTIEKKLKKYLGFEDKGSEIKATSIQVVVPDESILRYFGADTRSIFISECVPWKYNAETNLYIDQWGIGYKKNPDGNYFNFYKHPLSEVEKISDLDKYQFPDPYSEVVLYGLEEKIKTYKDEYCLILEGLREPMFGLPSWLRENTNFYLDLAMDDGFVDALLDRVLDHYLKWTGFLLDRIGKHIDIVKVADDLGTQDSLLLSPEMYRKHIKPRQAILYKNIKEKCHCKILLHSCGAIRPIIPDLIEIGVDAINPVQISAKGMEPTELKKEFGGKITFWGGGVDTQHTLSFASPKEVKKEVKKNMEIFKTNGGYVFAQVHNIMPEVPIENVIAMYEAYKESADY
jgi:uroporphyrinogen decarboxylase